MSEPTMSSDESHESTRSLFEKVSSRVSEVAATLDPAPSVPAHSVQTQALWRVFHDFGAGYRDERRQAGLSPSPGVRDAAEAFRRDPTLNSLVAVASVLHEHGFPARSI